MTNQSNRVATLKLQVKSDRKWRYEIKACAGTRWNPLASDRVAEFGEDLSCAIK